MNAEDWGDPPEEQQTKEDSRDVRVRETQESEKELLQVEAVECHPFGEVCDLPETIYGAAMMVACLLAQGKLGAMHGVGATVMLGLVMNVVMQSYVLYCTRVFITYPAVKQVRALYAHYHTEVWPDGVFSEEAWGDFDNAEQLCQMPFSQPLFFTAILLTWTGTCMVDIKETLKFINLWWQLPTPTSTERGVDLKKTDDGIMASSASGLVKFLVITFVLLPKLLIAMLLWWLGARWLSATPSFSNLLLNAVALAFITALSELIYQTLVPEDVMALVNTYKIKRLYDVDFEEHKDDHEYLQHLRDRVFVWRMLNMIGSLVLVVGIPFVYFRFLQQVLPDYKWDIHEVCETWLANFNGAGS